MTYLSDALVRWEQGPYAMKALIGAAINVGRGKWFAQLRTPADNLFDQVVISNAEGSSRQDAIDRAMQHGGVTEVIEWDRAHMGVCGLAKTHMQPEEPHGLALALARCELQVTLLCRALEGQRNGT